MIKIPLVPQQPLTTPLPARSGRQVITTDWLLDLPNASSDTPNIRWLDNTQLIYASGAIRDTPEWSIELLDVNTREHKILGKGSNPEPSPDGQWIAYTFGKKEEKQLWIMKSNGSNPKQLSHIQDGLGDCFTFNYCFAWSPDSKKIAVSHQPCIPYWGKKKKLESSIYVFDLRTGHSKQIVSLEASIRYLSWHPNGEELLFVKERLCSIYNEEDREWLKSIRIHDGYLRTLAEFDGIQQFLAPTASPDGRFIAVAFDADNPIFNYMPSICIIPNDISIIDPKKTITRLTYEIKLFGPKWSRDGQRIYALRDHGAYKQIYSIDVKTGESSQITNSPLNIRNYALSPDGLQIAWIGQDAQATCIIRVASSDGHNVRDLCVILGVPNDMALSEVREVDWEVPDYPTRMRGLLLLPLNYHEGTHYPLIVDIHGGGPGAHIFLVGGILLNSPLEWHLWAAKGYAVFVPEFRSSASFGSIAITRDDLKEHDLINCDIRDIEAGIDSLISCGLVEPHRLAVIGHSAGGRRANWLTATTHRFRVVISKEGWADDWITALKDSSLKRLYFMFGGAPWEVPQNYQKNSALFHVLGATTPTLFLMGNKELGGADTEDTVHMLYNALKGQGVETEYVKYQDEGHVFQKSENLRDALERTIKWIEKQL